MESRPTFFLNNLLNDEHSYLIDGLIFQPIFYLVAYITAIFIFIQVLAPA